MSAMIFALISKHTNKCWIGFSIFRVFSSVKQGFSCCKMLCTSLFSFRGITMHRKSYLFFYVSCVQFGQARWFELLSYVVTVSNAIRVDTMLCIDSTRMMFVLVVASCVAQATFFVSLPCIANRNRNVLFVHVFWSSKVA